MYDTHETFGIHTSQYSEPSDEVPIPKFIAEMVLKSVLQFKRDGSSERGKRSVRKNLNRRAIIIVAVAFVALDYKAQINVAAV